MRVAELIVGVVPQGQFLEYILSNKITNEDDVRKAKRWFLNTTIYTIGYEGKESEQFIGLLKKNGIEHLVDVRFSAESQYKPEFNEKDRNYEVASSYHWIRSLQLKLPNEIQEFVALHLHFIGFAP